MVYTPFWATSVSSVSFTPSKRSTCDRGEEGQGERCGRTRQPSKRSTGGRLQARTVGGTQWRAVESHGKQPQATREGARCPRGRLRAHLGARALVKLVEDGQEEGLLLLVALKLLEHLPGALGELGAVAAGVADVEAQQQVEHLRVERLLSAICCIAESTSLRVERRIGALLHRTLVHGREGLHDLRVNEERQHLCAVGAG